LEKEEVVQGMSDKVVEVLTEILQEIKILNERVEKIETQAAMIRKGVESVDNTLGDMEGNISSIDDTVSSIDVNVSNISLESMNEI